jgi:response regulator RpfG family c-di-GMP phosphodiesterase
MSKITKYFKIGLDEIGQMEIFPFHLYIFNPETQSYSPFLHPNRPLTKVKKDFMKYILERGGEIAVELKQKQTFLHNCEATIKRRANLDEKSIDPIQLRRENNLNVLNELIKRNGEFDIAGNIQNAVMSDNFIPLIQRAALEISTLPSTVTHTLSLAIYLSDSLLNEDNLTNRIVTFSYFLAKSCHITEKEDLGDLISGAFFHHLGYSQLNYTISRTPQINLSDKLKQEYKTHTNLAKKLLKKSQIKLSPQCIQIICDHHERDDGSGFPVQKVGNSIESLSQILGVSSHIVELSLGQITGFRKALDQILENIQSNELTPDLEKSFAVNILEGLSYLQRKQLNKAA